MSGTTGRERTSVAPFPPRQGALQILALWTFAVAQPIYHTLSSQVPFFIAHDCQPIDILVFLLAVSFIPPVLLIALNWAVFQLFKPAHNAAHLTTCGLLGVLLGLQVAKVIVASTAAQLAIALALGLIGTAAMARSEQVRRFVGILAFSVLVCPILFLSNAPIQQIAMGVLNTDPLLAPVRTSTPIVFVIFDELPSTTLLDSQGKIDASRFPNFAALADECTWYPYASSTCDDTALSVPSILTSLAPNVDKSPLISDHPKSLFSWLGATYQLRVEEYITRLAPRGSTQTIKDSLGARLRLLAEDTAIYYLHIALPKELAAAWVPSIEFSWDGFAKPKNAREARSQDFRRFIETLEPSEKPTLFFKHALLPHYPYVYLPSGQEYDNSGASVCDGLEGLAWRGDWEAKLGLQRQLLQTAFLDKLVGEMVAKLKSNGLYDQAILVVTSDHGAAFRGGIEHRKTSMDNVAESMFVPLFIKEPSQKQGQVSYANATTVDILPTVADILGLELPWQVNGKSLRQPARIPTGGKTFLANLHQSKGVLLKVDDWQARLARSSRQIASMFPVRGLAGLYQAGPRPELYGKPLESLSIGEASPFGVELEFSGLLENVDTSAPFLPVRLKGTLTDYGAKDRVALAVALHGKLAATSYVMPNGQFEVLLDPSVLRSGDNPVQLFLIEADKLRPLLEKKGESYRWQGGQLVNEKGQTYPLEPLADSLLDQWIVDQNRVTVNGWIKTTGEVSTRRLLVFKGEQFVCDWPLEGQGTVEFKHEVPRSLVGEETPRLVVLLSDGSAAELARREHYVLGESVVAPPTH